MIDPGTGLRTLSEVVFNPIVWSLLYVEQPNIILCLVACVASKNDEEWLGEDHSVSISLTRRNLLIRHLDGSPCWPTSNAFLLILQIEEVQVILQETLRT